MPNDIPDSFRMFAVSTRVSTDGQTDGTSKAVQADSCKQFGESRNWEYVATFDDVISGGSNFEDRPAMQEILKLLQRRVITDVIFFNVDRAARDLDVLKKLFTEIYRLGGCISIAQKGRTYGSYSEEYDDCLFEGFISMYEKQKIRSRTESGKIFAFENDAVIAIVKTGYKRVKESRIINGRTHTLTCAGIDENAAEYVNLILDTIIECGNKNAAMVKLNKQGVKTINGLPMRPHVFDDIAGNVMLYAGEPVLESIRVDNKSRTLTRTKRYPAIVTLEKAHKIQKILDSIVRKNANPNKPFLGVGYCKHCGKKAFVSKSKNAKGGYLLMCSDYKNALTTNQRRSEKVETTECNRHISLQPVIDAIHHFLLHNYNNDSLEMGNFEIKVTAKTIKIISLENDIKTIDADNDALETEISTLTKAYVSHLSNPDFMDISKELNNQIKQKRQQVTDLQDARAKLLQEIQDRKRGLGTLGIMPSEADYLDIRNRCEKSWTKPVTKDTQFELIKEIYARHILPGTQGTREKIQALVQELAVENWEQVNGLMHSIGLSFTVDFSEPDREIRRNSVRVQLSAL